VFVCKRVKDKETCLLPCKELKNKASREDLLQCDIGFNDLKAFEELASLHRTGQEGYICFLPPIGNNYFFYKQLDG
jgi:hypothetical protein